MQCPQCRFENPEGFRYCGQCGYGLDPGRLEDTPSTGARAERKHVTILFSDLSGYTTLSESIDPEDVKAIMGRIFAESVKIVQTYSGTVERFFGDEILAIFGAPVANEDDPFRAILVAKKIHDAVEHFGKQIRDRIGMPLLMHSGINTGIVVTDENNQNPLSCGLTGDAINLAKRLQGLAGPGDILVGQETFHQTAGYFVFDHLPAQQVKGKSEPVPVFRVVSAKASPRKTHRPYGTRAKLIGRSQELDILIRAAANLKRGKSGIISVCGEAGTGKSRLIEEFKSDLNLDVTHWCEGYAYAYAQNISYFPIIDLLHRHFRILEGDSPETIREKVATGIARYGSSQDVMTYIGGLFSFTETNGEIYPEHWKTGLHDAIRSYWRAVAQEQPTVVCLEDLHWADPSTMDLLHSTLTTIDYPALFLLVYRPPFAPIRHRLLKDSGVEENTIHIHPLSVSETQEMVRSLLRSERLPNGLVHFIEENIEGNPFYLEEIINSLVESGTLVLARGAWNLARPIRKSEIALTINGVISARLDRLPVEMKEILQEASVIGRSFMFDVLEKITTHGEKLKSCLDELESLDLIRITMHAPRLEFDFKHALTRDVVYSGLLKSERQEIHERIGGVMEDLFSERLAEFFETLAFHYKKGRSLHKAVDYLMRSGNKSLKRYSVDESHQYYMEAYNLLIGIENRTDRENKLLIELLTKWAPVYYYRGRFKEFEHLLNTHLDLAETIGDPEIRGMFYVGMGMCKWGREKFKDSYLFMSRALAIAKEIGSKRLQGYTCAWLPWICVELGCMDEALAHGDAARKLVDHFESDHYPYYQSLDALGFVHYAQGNGEQTHAFGRQLSDFGQKTASVRGMTWGHFIRGCGYLAQGLISDSIRSHQEALATSADPFYTQFPRLFLGISYVTDEQFDKAKATLLDVADLSDRFGSELLGNPARTFLAVVAAAQGRIADSIQRIESFQQQWIKHEARWRYCFSELILGEIFLGMVLRKTPLSPTVVFRNLPFLIQKGLRAAQLAESHYRRAIDTGLEIGVIGIPGQAQLGLCRLYKARKKPAAAKQAADSAIELFRQCHATGFIKQAEDLLATL